MTEFRYSASRNIASAAIGAVAHLMVDEKLDSPTEALMLLAFRGAKVPDFGAIQFKVDRAPPGRDPEMRVFKQVPLGEFTRVDFILESWTGKRWRRVIIECDGHEFHARLPEQVERDYRRGREFIAAGYIVLRFAGREIIRDPQVCVQEALKIAREGQ